MLNLLKEKGYRQASLAVQKANYAVRMYEKVGFKTVDENDEEYIMLCELRKERLRSTHYEEVAETIHRAAKQGV